MIPLIVGTTLALAALTFVLYPLLAGTSPDAEPEAPVRQSLPGSGRSDAIDALREIEFDRETGKLSDTDYSSLKASYTQRAVDALRTGECIACPRCGPRPESDARFCSNCGLSLLP